MSFSIESIPNQSGRVVIVTGGNSGIGLESSRALAIKGATVIMACRNLEKGVPAQKDILLSAPHGDVKLMQLDLSDLESIEKFSIEFKSKYQKLDLLINNAGVMALPFGKTRQGFETTFGTNHLGHFALTGRLLERLQSVNDSRIVTLSSLAHRQGKIDFENLNAEIKYSKSTAYAQSKLANLLFSFELERRLRKTGAKTFAIAAHPGWTITNLQVNTKLFTFLNPFFGQDSSSGALPSLFAATASGVNGGEYYGPEGILELQGPPKRVQASSAAQNMETASRLWEVSEKLTGVRYLD